MPGVKVWPNLPVEREVGAGSRAYRRHQLRAIGIDEVVFLPTMAELDQLERLADLVG